MSWFLVGGAAIGAGVGAYGQNQWGWSKDAIWKGALMGGGAGFAAGPSGFGLIGGATKSAVTAGSGSLPNMAGAVGAGGQMAGAASATGGGVAATSAGAGGWLTKPLIPGMAFTNPLILGAGALTLASGGSSQGPSFQDKIELSKEGKKLQGQYTTAARGRLDKAKVGDVSDRAFQDISNLKTAEGIRQRATQGSINTIQARAGNVPKEARGGGVVGGAFVKAQVADVGERMTGLFAPTSTLNAYRKEELVNATKHIQNLANLDNQTASFNYSSSLANWNVNQALSGEKGAAIGSVAAMMGGTQLQTAYLNQMKIAS